MNQQVVIEEHEMTPEIARLFEQGRRNLFWFRENAERLGDFKTGPSHYYFIPDLLRDRNLVEELLKQVEVSDFCQGY